MPPSPILPVTSTLTNPDSPKERELYITKVEIYNWDGTLVLRGDYAPQSSQWIGEQGDRLVVAFENGRIEALNPAFEWKSQYLVRYIRLVEDN